MGLEPTKNSFAGCCLDRFGIATKLVLESISNTVLKTALLRFLGILRNSELYRILPCQWAVAPPIRRISCRSMRLLHSGSNTPTNEKPTGQFLAVGRKIEAD